MELATNDDKHLARIEKKGKLSMDKSIDFTIDKITRLQNNLLCFI